MTNSKWLRRALLGSVALTVAGTSGARADELADLKAQLEALQSRVNTIEQQPAQASNLPPGASFVTFERGSRMDFVAQDRASDRVNQNDDAGFTIADHAERRHAGAGGRDRRLWLRQGGRDL